MRFLTRSLAVAVLALMALSVTPGGAKAALYCSPSGAFGSCAGPISFSYTVSNPGLVTTAVFVTPAPGTEFGNFGTGAGSVDQYLESLFGALPDRSGGACGTGAVVANFCSGGTTNAGHSSLSGNLFAVHIGGRDGAMLAFLYSGVVNGFDISYTASAPSITGLSSIWAYNTAVTPIPAAVWLFGSGLAVLGFVGRKRKKGVSPTA